MDNEKQEIESDLIERNKLLEQKINDLFISANKELERRRKFEYKANELYKILDKLLLPNLLSFILNDTDDKELTCFFCCKTNVDKEFSYTCDDKFGQRRTVTCGVHSNCMLDPKFR